MARYLLAISFMVFHTVTTIAQDFSPFDTLQMDNMSNPVFEWADLDNDGRLDILVTGANSGVMDASISLTYIYKQNADTTFTRLNPDLQTYGDQLFRLTDINRDGRQDLVMSATDGLLFEHAIYINEGGFTFSKILINQGTARWQELRLADLDNDGMEELLTSSEEGLVIYKQEASAWLPINLPQEISTILTDPVVLDFDTDGYLDLFIAGKNSDGDPLAWLMINQRELMFETQPVESDSLQIADYVVSDFNGDGLPDVLLSRNVDTRSRALEVLLNQSRQRFTALNEPNRLKLKNARVFAADLTSDGLLDTDIEGQSPGPGPTIVSRERVIRQPGTVRYERDTLVDTSGQGRRYGDFDFDGDLDYFEVDVKPNGTTLWLFENKATRTNEGPENLQDLLSFRFMDNLYLVWNGALDDHTNRRSVTYDVTLSTVQGEANLVAGGFDPVTLKRTKVGPGNQGHNQFMVIKDAPQDEIFATIMPLDNAFHYSATECLQGSSPNCNEELQVNEMLICGNNVIQLNTETGEQARWFSFAGGYLGMSSSITLSLAGDDFIIAVYDRAGSCVDGEVFAIQYDRDPSNLADITVCEGDEVSVSIEGSWETVEWISANEGTLSNTNDLTYTPVAQDVVTLRTTTARGCEFEQQFNVNIVDFNPFVRDSVYVIEEGESIRLEAGGGTEYLWLPNQNLSNNQVANPVASPDVTTQYSVFILNDANCAREFNVRVEVVQNAFAPDVFSPNGDGRNERFRVYDLETAGDLVFSIFDRSGNKVFETTSLGEITSQGWDGTQNGTEVPAGTYFWRVKGVYPDGQEIKINGSKRGALQLIR